MKRKKMEVVKKEAAPTIEEMRRLENLPKLPRQYKQAVWRTTLINVKIRITQELDHHLNMMGLHFGLKRDEIIAHAVNLLWQEVASTIGRKRILEYEEKLEASRLYRLYQREGRNEARERKTKNPRAFITNTNGGLVWTYRKDDALGKNRVAKAERLLYLDETKQEDMERGEEVKSNADIDKEET
jgi:hypothetical protein